MLGLLADDDNARRHVAADEGRIDERPVDVVAAQVRVRARFGRHPVQLLLGVDDDGQARSQHLSPAARLGTLGPGK